MAPGSSRSRPRPARSRRSTRRTPRSSARSPSPSARTASAGRSSRRMDVSTSRGATSTRCWCSNETACRSHGCGRGGGPRGFDRSRLRGRMRRGRAHAGPEFSRGARFGGVTRIPAVSVRALRSAFPRHIWRRVSRLHGRSGRDVAAVGGSVVRAHARPVHGGGGVDADGRREQRRRRGDVHARRNVPRMADRRMAMAGPVIVAVVLLLFGAPSRADAASAREWCTTCHRGIEDAHPKKTLSCTTCHRGDDQAADKVKAHAGMYANPSDLRVVDRTCGAGGCHQTIAAKVKSSIMAHRSGTQSGTLFPNGLQPTREGVNFAMAPVATTPGVPLPKGHPLPPGAVPRLEPIPTFTQSGDPFLDLLRKECTSCHLWTPAKQLRGNFRATGCAACHMPYAENASKPIKHQ